MWHCRFRGNVSITRLRVDIADLALNEVDAIRNLTQNDKTTIECSADAAQGNVAAIQSASCDNSRGKNTNRIGSHVSDSASPVTSSEISCATMDTAHNNATGATETSESIPIIINNNSDESSSNISSHSSISKQQHTCLSDDAGLVLDCGTDVIAAGKHLCGAATDLALHCLQNSGLLSTGPESSISVVIAFCCHHKCSWQHYAGKTYFKV